MFEHNVIAVSFEDRSNAYQALSELKGAALEGRVEVLAASIVTRDKQGRLNAPEEGDVVGGAATLGGSLIGLMIGVIGGPIGMLFGWTGGLLVGGAFDIRRADQSDSVLGEISRYIPVGGTAVIAELNEYAVEVVDKLMTELGGTVYRRSAEVVLTELEAAEDAYWEAQKEADRAAHEQRKAERHQQRGRAQGGPQGEARRLLGRRPMGAPSRAPARTVPPSRDFSSHRHAVACWFPAPNPEVEGGTHEDRSPGAQDRQQTGPDDAPCPRGAVRVHHRHRHSAGHDPVGRGVHRTIRRRQPPRHHGGTVRRRPCRRHHRARQRARRSNPARHDARHPGRVDPRAGNHLVPAVLLLLSDTGLWSLRTGLTLAIAALTVTQLVLVLWGLRGSSTTTAQKAGYLLLQLAAVGAVVLLKVIAH